MECVRNSSYLREHGADLVASGYPVIPIEPGKKHPNMSGWSELSATVADVEKWLSNGFANGGVGILSKNLPAIDIDVRDESEATRLREKAFEIFGPTVERIGEAPKTLLVYRTETPFKKISSKKYEDFLGNTHQIEVLGTGNQFVAFAVHPGTNEPYRWVGKSILDVEPEALHAITLGQIHDFIEYFESTVPDDWEIVQQGNAGGIVDDGLSSDERALANAKPKANVSKDRLKQCLEKIDADDYHRWVNVGMALYHQFDGSIDGFELWDSWSQSSDKYDAHGVSAKWQTFDANLSRTEPVTAASILRLARLSDEQNQQNSLEAFLHNYVYVEEGDRVCDLRKPPYCSISKLAEFKNRTANVRHEIPAPTAKNPDNVKLEAVWKSWMVQPDRKSAEGVIYAPKEGRLVTDDYGLDWVNEFHMSDLGYTQARDNLEVFNQHMDYLFPKEVEREWFIDWMAFNIQFPEKRCKVTPLHVATAHGTGRGWLVELMGRLLGQWNCKKTKMDVLSGEGNGGGFHDFFNNSLFCAIEEVKEGGKRFAVSDRIRDLLTENFLEVNIKHGSKKTQQVFTNFFFMTNHPDALVLSMQDRRINVFSGPTEPRSEDYYRKLYAWLESDGVAQLGSLLGTRDLSQFNWTRSMDTEARSNMISNNRTETETLFWELMESPECQAMTAKQVVNALVSRSEGDAFDANIDENQVTKLLQNNAIGPIIIKVKGKTRRAWQLVKGQKLDNKTIKEEIEKCGF